MSEGPFVYQVPYRHCIKRDGLTYPIAVCVECKRVVEPERKEYSKTGAHGTWYYAHPHPLAIILLERTNSGKRSVVAGPGVPRPLREIVRELWLYRGWSAEEVEEAVAKWLIEEWKAELDTRGEPP